MQPGEPMMPITVAVAFALAMNQGPPAIGGPCAMPLDGRTVPVPPSCPPPPLHRLPPPTCEGQVMTGRQLDVRTQQTKVHSVEVEGRRYEVRILMEVAVSCEIDPPDYPGTRSERRSESELELEIVEDEGLVTFSRKMQAENHARFDVVPVEGSRGRGLVVQMFSQTPGMDDVTTELTLLSASDGALAPRRRTLRIWGALPDSRPAQAQLATFPAT